MWSRIKVLTFLVVAGGCSSTGGGGAGGDGSGGETGTQTAASTGSATKATSASTGAGTIECYSKQCDAQTQFCIISEQNNVALDSVCANLPAGCTNCDCANDATKPAWAAANPGTNNCSSATLFCDSSAGSITVTCIR